MRSVERQITLNGTAPILFDRYPGTNDSKDIPPEKKCYLTQDSHLYLPAINIMSFLAAETGSAPTVCLGKQGKSIAAALAASVSINPFEIPFTRDGKPIVFGEFVESADGQISDPLSGMTIVGHVARVKKAGLSIPNPKIRPMLSPPWALSFKLSIAPHEKLSETLVEDLFTRGGQYIGLGTFRRFYGKFNFCWK